MAVYDNVYDLDTPALVVDLDVMENNLRRVADYAASHHLRLRPHTKTHKSLEVGRRQLALGAVGLTVAKVGEAQVMLQAKPAELLVAFPVIGKAKLDRLVEVARETQVTVALDSEIAAQQLSAAAQAGGVSIGVLVEVDVGLNRVGMKPDGEALDLARKIQRLPGLTLRGITCYPGHIKNPADHAEILKVGGLIGNLVDAFRREGIETPIVSGGSTPALFHSHEMPGLNEIRPGTYVYNDMNTVEMGACRLEDCAASILATVVSVPREGSMFIDGGSKTFSSDRPGWTSDATFGLVVDDPACRFHRMNEEHGFIDTSKAQRKFKVGDKIRIIPNHVCVAVNLHEQVFGVRGENVETVWKVEGRGKLQ